MCGLLCYRDWHVRAGPNPNERNPHFERSMKEMEFRSAQLKQMQERENSFLISEQKKGQAELRAYCAKALQIYNRLNSSGQAADGMSEAGARVQIDTDESKPNTRSELHSGTVNNAIIVQDSDDNGDDEFVQPTFGNVTHVSARSEEPRPVTSQKRKREEFANEGTVLKSVGGCNNEAQTTDKRSRLDPSSRIVNGGEDVVDDEVDE